MFHLFPAVCHCELPHDSASDRGLFADLSYGNAFCSAWSGRESDFVVGKEKDDIAEKDDRHRER